jgi:hypothetical protein
MHAALCDEAVAVELNKLRQFERVGFSHYDAIVANNQQIDWHDVERLLDQGCSQELALAILAPLS